VRKSVIGLVAPLALVIGAVLAPSAQAAPAQCSFSYEQPFWSWTDANWYGLAPGASFENGGKAPSGWSLAGGAAAKAPGNPYRPWSNTYSLYLPAGSSATTPAFCVDLQSPFARMFAQTTTVNTKYTGALRVDLIYTDAKNKSVTKTVATLNQQSAWNPTAAFPLIDSTVAPKWDSTGRATVKYKFTPLYSTAWRIDDLFIDPKKH